MSRIVLPRRTVLKGMGATAGLAACGQGPDSGRAPDASGPGQIDTIVILMMENRSFDHVFGALSLLEGRADVDGLRPDMTNLDLAGNRVDIRQLTEPCTEPDPPHGWSTSRTQLDAGTCGGFVKAYQTRSGTFDLSQVMAYQTREQQPISYALADEYALCQRWYSSVLSRTWPNRIYWHAATSMGVPDNSLPGGPYSCRTIWDQLNDAGIDWGYYFSDLPTLALFGRDEWQGNIHFIDQFYRDAEAGTLPRVVCVDPAASYNDDHPPYHPMLGQMFIASIYQALADSVHWDTCAFIATYDEAGGFFDHVPPPLTEDDHAAEGFDQLGFRVPSLFMGPYAQNTVSDLQLEHSAALTFIQNQHGIDERLTRRNEVSADLGELLDLDALAAGAPRPPIRLPAIERSEEEVEAECSSLGGHTGQPELRDLVRERCPQYDRTGDLPSTARGFWRRLGEQGLWVPSRI